MALDLAEQINADIVIGTDPDSDRLGIAVRNQLGQMKILNGNQTMCLLTDFLLSEWKDSGNLDGTEFVGSTIVSTNLVSEIASGYGIETKIGLTGFKWIAKMIRDAEGQQRFIGGGEESFGYMVGDFVRDKDAVTATLLACEIASAAKAKGSSTYEELLTIYAKHHYYKEHLISLVKKGMNGAAEIAQMMVVYDYKSSVKTDLINNNLEAIDIPKSNVLIYETSDGTRIAARPSGTEPKIKFYFSVKGPMKDKNEASIVEDLLQSKINRMIKELKLV
jgi:phosphoglucomutase